MDKKIVFDFLDKLNIEYATLKHPAAVDTESIKYLDENLVSEPCKNLFLVNRQETEFYLLMMPRAKDFRTKYIKEQLGIAHLSFAKPEQMKEKLDVYPGSVSVMCLLNKGAEKVHFILDEDVRKSETVRFHVGDNTCSARVSTKEFMDLIVPSLVDEVLYVDIPR